MGQGLSNGIREVEFIVDCGGGPAALSHTPLLRILEGLRLSNSPFHGGIGRTGPAIGHSWMIFLESRMAGVPY
jgi:hypothetical protein